MIGNIPALDGVNLFSTSGTATANGTNAIAGTGVEASFGSLVAGAVTETVGSLRGAEQMSIAALQGQADTREVVDAVMNAEQALQAAISIRDKIVSSYLEISRMAI